MIEKYLLNFGFNEQQIKNILKDNLTKEDDKTTLYKKIKLNNGWFYMNGFSSKNIIKIVSDIPQIYTLPTTQIDEIYNCFLSLGYLRIETRKILIKTPRIFISSVKEIKEKIIYLSTIDYTKLDTIKLFPFLLEYNTSSLKEKVNNYNKLGISTKDLINISKTKPNIYNISEDSIKNKISDIINLGFTHKEVIIMISLFPLLFNLNIETIKEKVEFYSKLNIKKILIFKPRFLRQSINLSYARYMFYLKEKNEIINLNTVQKPFITEKLFIKKFNISNEELLNKYNYEETRLKLC